MKLFDRFEIIAPYPALYIPALDMVAVSDLHLGMEDNLTRNGTYMPKFQLEELLDDLRAILEETGAGTVIINGDLKHEFSHNSSGEREEVSAFIEDLSALVDHIVIVKGNHDNYVHYLLEEYDTVELTGAYIAEDIAFIHGHTHPEDLEVATAKTLIIGHEHPAVALEDDIGHTEKVPSFLYGEMDDGRELIVLPAFSKLADGTPMNNVKTDNEILSPVLKDHIDLEDMRAVAVDPEVGALPLPAIKKF